jgi:hypothetical protein
MGFKGYRLWVMGQLDSNLQRPTVVVDERMMLCRQVWSSGDIIPTVRLGFRVQGLGFRV